MHARFFFGWCLAAALVAGCGESSGPGDDAGGSGDSGTMDDGAIGRDGGPIGGEQCGAVTCDLGMVCCNESCGICTLPGEGCTAIECLPDGGVPVDCDGTTCVPGEICCPGCGGTSFCTDETTCPDLECPGCLADGSECNATQYCDYPPDTCGGTGVCMDRPEICTADCPGVCGCDGNDYCNACNAASAGVDTASTGPCVGTGTFCGGFIGATCEDTEYCDYPDEAFCGFADGSGTCVARPTSCAGEPRAPVCGCDGTDYTNACEAYILGVDVQATGPCATRP